MNLQLGSQLHPKVQKDVKRRFVHRFTKDHKPEWANRARPDGKPYKPQFASDQDWLNNTSFHIKSDGTLDNRYKYCCSNPTWPEGTAWLRLLQALLIKAQGIRKSFREVLDKLSQGTYSTTMNNQAFKIKKSSTKPRKYWNRNPVQQAHSTPSGKKRPGRQDLKQRLRKEGW